MGAFIKNDESLDVLAGIALLDEIPVGGLIKYGSSSNVPDGYLVCDGSEIKKSEYRELYEVIKNIYGTASSEEYFKLPNFNDRVLIGDSSTHGLGTVGGEKTHKMTIAEMPKHGHDFVYTVKDDHDHGGYSTEDGNHYHQWAAVEHKLNSGSFSTKESIGYNAGEEYIIGTTFNFTNNHTHTMTENGEHEHTTTYNGDGDPFSLIQMSAYGKVLIKYRHSMNSTKAGFVYTLYPVGSVYKSIKNEPLAYGKWNKISEVCEWKEESGEILLTNGKINYNINSSGLVSLIVENACVESVHIPDVLKPINKIEKAFIDINKQDTNYMEINNEFISFISVDNGYASVTYKTSKEPDIKYYAWRRIA